MIPLKTMIAVTMISLADSTLTPAEAWPRVILRGDYPDPSILRDGSDYYLTHSPFLYTPGFLIWHSRDLIHWEPVCRAMTKVVGSAMAPELVKHGGRYFIYFPTQLGWNFVIWADDIRGPWSEPVDLKVRGIDPGHIVGEDGKRYLFLDEGQMVPLSDDGLSTTGPKEKVYAGWEYPSDWKTEGMYLESPKLIRKDGWFHMLVAEGGTAGPATSHMVAAARSKSIRGPWDNSPYNPIVHTYSADEQWWSKGHGTLIDDVNGNWWIVYHAYEKGQYPLGRQTLLEPIEWLEDGWFRATKNAKPIEPKGTPVPHGMKLSDDFAGEKLGLQWTAWRDYDAKAITLKDSSLHLEAHGTTPKDARLLLTTATDHSYETEVEITLAEGSVGGLILFYSEKAFAGLSSDGRQFTVYENADRATQFPNRFGSHFFLKIINRQNTCDLLASADGKLWETIQAGVDVSQMHHNTHFGFFALRIGLMAAGQAPVKFNQFTYHP